MKIFEYPNYLYTYFKENDLENNFQLAKEIVDDNSDKFYLRTFHLNIVLSLSG